MTSAAAAAAAAAAGAGAPAAAAARLLLFVVAAAVAMSSPGAFASRELAQASEQCDGQSCMQQASCLDFSCECGPKEQPGTYAILVSKSYKCDFKDFWACARTDRNQEATMNMCLGTEHKSEYGGAYCGDPASAAACPTCSGFILASYVVPRNVRVFSLFTHARKMAPTPLTDWSQPLCGGADTDPQNCPRMCNHTKTLSEIGCRATCPDPVPTCANTTAGSGPPVKYSCQRGTYDPSKDNQQYPEEGNCCQPTCRDTNLSSSQPQAFACPRGIFDPSKADKAQPSMDVCCAPTCGDASLSPGEPAVPFACPGGVLDPASLGSVEVTPSTCCMPTCGSSNVSSSTAIPYGCPDGWAFSDAAANSTWPSDVACCTKDGGPGPELDLKLSKSGPSRLQVVDQPISYRLLVEVVDGAEGIDAAAVQDNLPSGLEVVQPLPSDCAFADEVVSCETGPLAFGESKAFNISIRATRAGTYTNFAEIATSTPPDRDLPKTAGKATDNEATAIVTVLGACCNVGSCSHSTSDECVASGGSFSADKNCSQARCFVAKCGDINPDAPGTPLACNPKTVFNAANRGRSPVSFQMCCLPTCSNTDVDSAVPQPLVCPPDYELNPATLDDTLVNEPNCCRLIPRYPADAVPTLTVEVLPSKKLGSSSRQAGNQVSLVGQAVQYRTTVSVNGLRGWVAKAVTVNASLELGMRFIGQAPKGCSFSQNRQNLECQPFDLQWNETRVLLYNATSQWAGQHETKVTVTLDNDPDPTNNDASAVILVLGACCDNANGPYKCTDRTEDDCNQLQGTFRNTKSCSSGVPCTAPRGACCIPGVRCSVTTQQECKAGRWKLNGTCSAGFCPIKPPTGSCCTKAAGRCSVTAEAACRAPGLVWTQNGKCSDQTCPAPTGPMGTCCVFANGTCSQTTLADCRGDRWQEAQQCSATLCPKLQCVAKWQACNPATTNSSAKCCPGSSCQGVPLVYPGSPPNVCKPDGQCVTAGKACGDSPGGGVCCQGFVCKSTSFLGQTCIVAADKCGVEADTCSSDDDCCPTFRCSTQGKCKKSVCNRPCSSPACFADRAKDCQRLQEALQSALAASA